MTRLAFLTALVLLAGGCSFDYRRAILPDRLDEAVPDAVFEDVIHVVSEANRPVMRISAESMRSFASIKEYHIDGVEFAEYGRDGATITEGSIESVRYHLDSEKALFQGMVELSSRRDGAKVRGRDLQWDNKNKILSGPSDAVVDVVKDDGSRLSGRGLRADLVYNRIDFAGPVSGTYVVPDD